MRNTLTWINGLTIGGGGILLALSLWPGFTGGCFMCFVLPLIFLLGIVWLHAVLTELVAVVRRAKSTINPRFLIAPVVVGLTLLLLTYYVPRRVAFLILRPQFDRLIATLPSDDHRPAELNKWIEVYRVDKYAIDPRGGVYLRTNTSQDGLGPDTVSHGFVYLPNSKGSPFGAARYRVRPISGGWYWFGASNDYH